MEGVLTLIGRRRRRPLGAPWRRWLGVIGLLFLCSTAPVQSADSSTNKPAKVKVSGFGLFGNREMRRLLVELVPGGKMPPLIDRTFAEDAVLLLISRGQEEGYLHATLKARFVMRDGSEARFAWTNALEAILTNDFA